jgi:hypothetical protein
MPGPVPGTTRWDRHAIDAALDVASGLESRGAQEDPFDRWKRERHEKSTTSRR